MSRSGIRVCWNIVIWMTQSFWKKSNKKCLKGSSSQSSHLIFRIKIRIEVDQIGLSLNSKRICRTVLMQCSKMNLAQSCLQKGKLVMKTIETVQCWVIYCKSSPKPANNTCTNHRKCTCLACNYCSSPKTHLTPRLNIPNKSCLNHKLQKNNTNKPNKFTRTCITCIIHSTKLMQINHNKEKRSSISMQITLLPTIWNITHLVLNTFKRVIHMSSIMHCQKNTCSYLQHQTLPSLNTVVVVSVQVRWSWISNLMVF